jgi:amidohydrolase
MNTHDPQLYRKLVSIRRDLHQHPELSHHEHRTAEKVVEWISQTRPDKLLTSLGGHGVAAIYDSGRPGPTVIFRCELDALPIKETSGYTYQSIYDGTAHVCGHDGHMAIMLGLAEKITGNRPGIGRAILLFQPAEETGTGAEKVITDSAFQGISPEYAFAIHNLPGFEIHQVVLADPVFSAGSIGMEIELTGKTSHAGEPENGINPAMAIAEIIKSYHEAASRRDIFDEYVLITIIQVALGEKAFGTSAGHALLRATIRAFNEKDLQNLVLHAMKEARGIADSEKLEININTTEEFPVTINHSDCTQLIRNLSDKHKWSLMQLKEPFRWSEDFGHFSRIAKSALIGIGSGIDHPKLHHPNYDFPEEIIPTGIEVFFNLYKHLLLL